MGESVKRVGNQKTERLIMTKNEHRQLYYIHKVESFDDGKNPD